MLLLLPLRPSRRALSAASCSTAMVPGSGLTVGVRETPGDAADAVLASAVLKTAAKTIFEGSFMALISRGVLRKLSACLTLPARGELSWSQPVKTSFTGAQSLMTRRKFVGDFRLASLREEFWKNIGRMKP